MAGLVIGSLITRYNKLSSVPRALAITVNNSCNLKCPHCYLQYNAKDSFISETLIGFMYQELLEHIAIVGMEPFKDRKTSSKSIELAKNIISSGKTVSAISNGVNLKFCSDEELQLFDFLDISLDGGRNTYQTARGASYKKILEQMKRLEKIGVRYNILNTVYQENVANIDDMLSVFDDCNPSAMYFNPYVSSRNDGTNSVKTISYREHLKAFSENLRFMQEPKAIMLFDRYNCGNNEIEFVRFKQWVDDFNLNIKTHLVPFTPLTLGILRVTYDGIILSPDEAMHPRDYPDCNRYNNHKSLLDFYNWATEREAEYYKKDQFIAA